MIFHRRNSTSPTGIYTCQIFNNSIYVGIYPSNQGISTSACQYGI